MTFSSFFVDTLVLTHCLSVCASLGVQYKRSSKLFDSLFLWQKMMTHGVLRRGQGLYEKLEMMQKKPR